MAFSIQRAVSDGTMTLLPISIEYFDREEISVLFNGVLNARQWAWVGTTDRTLSFTPAVADTVEVMIVRSTDLAALRHKFSLGAQFTAESLDESLLQILHIAQEAKEGSNLGEIFQNLNFHGFKAINIGNGSDPGDAVNHAQMQVHDTTIRGYRDECGVFAEQAELAAASVQLPIQVSSGGTGATSASEARTALGLGNAATKTIGTGAGQVPTADQVPGLANPAAATQAEMVAGTETALRMMSPLRVKQAIAANAGGGVSSVNGNTGAITAAQVAVAATAGYGYTPANAAHTHSYAGMNAIVAIASAQVGSAHICTRADGSTFTFVTSSPT